MSELAPGAQSHAATCASSGSAPASVWEAVDRSLFAACVQCGLCTGVCPTYRERGDENDGPRGRIRLMQAVCLEEIEWSSAVQGHLDLCVQCGACESACSYGVKYRDLIGMFRVAVVQSGRVPAEQERFHSRFVDGILSEPVRMRRWLRPNRLARRFRLDRLWQASGLWRLTSGRWGRMATYWSQPAGKDARLPLVLPARKRRRARVALFTGCLADALLRQVHWATARVLQENGCEVCVLQSQVCCGALHYQSGHIEQARHLMEQNARTFNANEFDAVIANSATCGAFLRRYGDLAPPGQRAAHQRLADRTRDATEFLVALGIVPPPGEIRLTVTYHDACQLAHAQRVREQPRELLRVIPGLQLAELPESELCCGAVGTYAFVQPGMADRLGDRKLASIVDSGARVVVASDVMCLLHIDRAARLKRQRVTAVHPMVLLDLSYRRAPFRF